MITAAAWMVNRRADRPPVYTQIGAALFFFLAAANGFGVQYLAWLVPWTIGVSLIPSAFFTLASGAFLLAVYNFWAGGFPWFLADSNYVGDFVPHLDYLLTLCWISVIALAVAVWRRRPAMPPRRMALVAAAIALPLIVWPLWNQVTRIDRRTYPAADDRAALSGIRAREYAMLSEVYYKMGRWDEALNAAKTAVRLAPDDETANAALAAAQSHY
jgi:hypothetical protein